MLLLAPPVMAASIPAPPPPPITASADQLKTLPGIGEADSQKIIKGQPDKRKNELVQQIVVPQATYDTIKEKIVTRQKED
jgi:competence protein ComEA